MLDMRALEFFVRVAELGTLGKASIALGVSPSILSRQVSVLERSLGYRLFNRTGRGVTLTEPGKRFLPRTQDLLRNAREFEEEARAIGGTVYGTVSVGVPGSIASMMAGPLFQIAREKHPRISIRFVEALSGLIEELLATGRIDLGLHYTDKANARRGEVPLCVVEMMLVSPPGDRLTETPAVPLRQLRHCPLVLPSFPHALRRLVEESCVQHGFAAQIALEVDSLSTMKDIVAAGRGVYTIAPYDAVVHDVAAGRVRIARITSPAIRRLLVMAPATTGKSSAATEVIQKLIQTQVRLWIKEGHWHAELP